MLSEKIWVTRKTRIYSEQRLQGISNFTQALMVAYSLALVSLSLWNLQSNSQKLNVISAFASIVLLVLSIYLIAQKYTERSITMRNCYVKLDELYSRAKRAEANNDEDELKSLESEYSSLLINIENHSEYDYLCFRNSEKNNKNTTLPPFTKADHRRYVFNKFWRVILGVIFFGSSLPFIVFIWFL